MPRVNELLREIIAEEIGKLKDPAIGFVTITAVETSPDLRNAFVFFTALGSDEEKAECAAGLERASSHIRSQLGAQVRIKYTPALEFRVDSSLEEGLRMDAILREISAEEESAKAARDNPLADELAQAAAALQEATEIAVSCHIKPDGDALGSAVGFARAAAAAGKSVVVSFGEPFELPDYFSLLALDLVVPPDEFPKAPEMMVTFDAADRSRLGSLAASSEAAGTLIVVDHHVTNDGFGDLNLIDGRAAASATIAYDLIRQLDWPLDAEGALALLLGVVTDTGRFQYSNTSSRTFRVAADLVEVGAHPEAIGQMVYENAPFGFLAVAGSVQQRAVLEPEISLVWSELRAADLVAAGITGVESEGLIDYLRIAREVDVAVLFTEVPEGTKASLRSRSIVDVGALAAAFGGGGHARAAGFSYGGPAAEAIEKVREYLNAQ
jgi:phosphoesterase RecJ-like protein